MQANQPRPFVAAPAPGEDNARCDSPGEKSPNTAPLKILIVEDEVFVAMDAEAILSEAGYAVVGTAATADEPA